MKKYLPLVVIGALAFTGLAQAHAHLKKSEPAADSTLSAAPKNLVLEFSEGVQLTALALLKGETKVQDLGPLPKDAAKQVTLSLPALTAGSYTVSWRGISDDKHVSSGKLTFKVQ
jgi:copper resistance protein C